MTLDDLAGRGVPRSRLKFVEDALLEVDEALEVAEKPLNTVQEIPRYHFPKRLATSVTDADREAPFKSDDHGCDAMRYLFHTLKSHGRAEIYRVG